MPEKDQPQAQRRTLDQLIHAGASQHLAATSLLRWLSQRDGAALVDDALKHFTEDQIRDVVDVEASPDKRRRPPAKVGQIDGVAAIWLTSLGWQRCGINRREQNPRAETLTHAQGPNALRDWIERHQHYWTTSPHDLTPRELVPVYRARVTSEPQALNDFTQDVSSAAWVRIKNASQDEAFGSLTVQAGKGGYKPDALLTEMVSADLATDLYNRDPHTGADLTSPLKLAPNVNELVTAVEVEQTRKTYERIGAKVKKAQAAIDTNICQSVLWVVSTENVWRDLVDLGVGSPAYYPRQRLIPAAWLGGDLTGAPIKNADPARIWAHWTIAFYAQHPQQPQARKR